MPHAKVHERYNPLTYISSSCKGRKKLIIKTDTYTE